MINRDNNKYKNIVRKELTERLELNQKGYKSLSAIQDFNNNSVAT